MMAKEASRAEVAQPRVAQSALGTPVMVTAHRVPMVACRAVAHQRVRWGTVSGRSIYGEKGTSWERR
jgi:hypothetical protein